MLHKDFLSFQVSRWQGVEQNEHQTGGFPALGPGSVPTLAPALIAAQLAHL